MNKYGFTLLMYMICNFTFCQEVIQLDYEEIPTHLKWERDEARVFTPTFNGEIVTNVSKPSLTVYRPNPEKANGTALIIAPGGGFHFLSIDNEGIDVAKWCIENGIAAFVLRYRLVPTGEDAAKEFMQKVDDQDKMDRDIAPYIEMAKRDGLAAIAYVREHADDFKVKHDQIGIMGFSAGGTVAASAAFEYEVMSRPNFSAPIYPALHVVNTDEIPDDPMPLFIAVTSDDVFGFQTQCADLYKKWNGAGESIEMHIYSLGGHGFGMHKQKLPVDQWTTQFKAWLALNGWL